MKVLEFKRLALCVVEVEVEVDGDKMVYIVSILSQETQAIYTRRGVPFLAASLSLLMA